jgi:hypothetical protein
MKQNVFSIDRTELLKRNSFYSSLYGLSDVEWMNINTSLERISDCDYLPPFTIVLKEQGHEFVIPLKRLPNCYPDSCRELMEGLENLFRKLDGK